MDAPDTALGLLGSSVPRKFRIAGDTLISVMDDLAISPGWVFFAGGIVGIVTVLMSRTFSWSNFEFLPSDEDRERQRPMTPARRAILLAICVGLAVWGAAWIQRDHGWDIRSLTSGSVSSR
jgi:hypothetical protein